MEDIFKERKDKLRTLKDMLAKSDSYSEEPVSKVPDSGVFVKCPTCGAEYTKNEFSRSCYVCTNCGYHQPISAYYRLSIILDSGSFRELNGGMEPNDPLNFPGYIEKVENVSEKTALNECVVTALGTIGGIQAVVGVMDSRFLMGSLGTATGEKITQAVEYADKHKLPLIMFCASGGARMQEGIFSLMQMAKTSAAVARFSANGGLYISCLTHPTTGGVSASFATLGDITLAEPNALIGFAGPRVIEQTIGQKLPAGFQRSEYLEEHGFVDHIVPRSEMRDTLALLLRMHVKGGGANA